MPPATRRWETGTKGGSKEVNPAGSAFSHSPERPSSSASSRPSAFSTGPVLGIKLIAFQNKNNNNKNPQCLRLHILNENVHECPSGPCRTKEPPAPRAAQNDLCTDQGLFKKICILFSPKSRNTCVILDSEVS